MSCTFWNMRRRKRALELEKEQKKEQPKAVEAKKPKKGVKKDEQ